MKALSTAQATTISDLVRATVLFTRAKSLYIASSDVDATHTDDNKERTAIAFKDITALLIELQLETGIEYEPNIKEWIGHCDVTLNHIKLK